MNHDAKLMVFDWDGTLMDSERHIVSCLRAAGEDMNFTSHDDNTLKSIIGLGLRETLETLYPGESDDSYIAYTDRYRHHFYSETSHPATLFDGAEELIVDLFNEGYLLGIATGKGRNGLNHILEETKLGDYFHMTRCSDETRSKPHPQMLLEITQELGVPPTETLMIGDTEFDMQMANNAGVHAIAVTYGVHDKGRLVNCQPKAHFQSLQALREWLFHENTDTAWA